MLERMDSLLKLAQIGQSRSSVINPLQWTLVMLLIAILALAGIRVPTWMLIFFVCAFGGTLCLLFCAYLFFMFRNPAALRSEKFSLAQQVIDNRLLGDSVSGTIITEYDTDSDLPLKSGPSALDIGSSNG
jgi:hypothetical protein